MGDTSAKALIDGGLGVATTASFAFGPTGMVVAGFLAGARFLIDTIWPAPIAGDDPMADLPDKAAIDAAMNSLLIKLTQQIWIDFENDHKAAVMSMGDTILDALRHTGTKDKTTFLIPGTTTVWNDGVNVSLFDPVCANPSALMVAMNWCETDDDSAYLASGLYTLSVGYYLSYCRTGLTWEVNENLRNYLQRKAVYDKTMSDYRTNAAIYAAQHNGAVLPPPTVTAPEAPTGGDFAVGAEVVDPVTKIVTYRSYLGKSLSAFAIALRDDLPRRIKYLQGVLDKYAKAKAARQAAVDARLSKFSIQTETINGVLCYYWSDAGSGGRGDDEPDQATALLQMSMAQGPARAPIWAAQTKSGHLDDLDDDDIKKLQQTLDAWTALLKIFTDALANSEDLKQGEVVGTGGTT